MAEIRINDFSAGWIPGDDPINGRKNGLLQMDNVELDSNGALTLQGGCVVKQSGYPANAHTLFSRLINGARHDYLALVDGKVYRDATLIITGGDATNAAFGTAFNYTLIASGDKRYKDSGSAIVGLGVLPPTAAITWTYSNANDPYRKIATIDDIAKIKTPTGSSAIIGSGPWYLQGTCDANGVWISQSYNDGGPYDATQLVGVGTGNTGYQTDEDYIQFFGYTPIVAGRTLQFDVLLVAGDSSGNQVSDYYSYLIKDLSLINYTATGAWFIRMRRKDFVRIGSGSQSWSTVYGFRITYSNGAASEVVNILGNALTGSQFNIVGGSKTQNGSYQYIQVNVNNTGSYVAKSVYGPISNVTTVDMGQTLLTPQDPDAIDTQVNELWIYRHGGLLDQWYRVMVIAGTAGAFTVTPTYDTMSDQDALTLNIKLNLNLVSIASTSIADKIYDIIGPINGRWYYFTTNFMYPSDINNPDLVDASLAVRITGSSSELFLWARQLNDSTILVGTSVDIYTLTGTFATFPDNSIDSYYRPLHVKYPPLTCDADSWGGQVYYLANDGWRVIDASGNNPSFVSPNLDRLYRGEYAYTYQPPDLKVLPRSKRLPVVLAKNKIWCFITGLTLPRIEIYDFIRQYWRTSNYQIGDVTAATHTQDGQVLAFYADKKLREIDIQSSTLIDATTKQSVALVTPVFDGQLPRNRKDSQTLKVRAKNSDLLTITSYSDVNPTIVNSIGDKAVATTAVDYPFDLANITNVKLCKTYQVKLTGSFSSLIIDDISILFTPRPEQTTFIRLQSNNYGTTARKRISSIPFQLDSMGGTVWIDSYLDGANVHSASYVSDRKTSFDHKLEGLLTPARDYEYVIRSTSLFEFFGFEEPRVLELYPQTVRSFNVPVTNYGSAARKRIRVQPFVLSSPQTNTLVIFQPVVDGVLTPRTNFNLTLEKATYRHYFMTDVFGVDYGGYFLSSGDFEVGEVLQPENVQLLPIAKRFDQVGPEEFFRYGKIKQIELRVLPVGGTVIPYTIYFNDSTINNGHFDVIDGREGTYFIMVPKGTSGNIVRIELGPTDFDFHRFYTRLQVTRSGKDTELEWINL